MALAAVVVVAGLAAPATVLSAPASATRGTVYAPPAAPDKSAPAPAQPTSTHGSSATSPGHARKATASTTRAPTTTSTQTSHAQTKAKASKAHAVTSTTTHGAAGKHNGKVAIARAPAATIRTASAVRIAHRARRPSHARSTSRPATAPRRSAVQRPAATTPAAAAPAAKHPRHRSAAPTTAPKTQPRHRDSTPLAPVARTIRDVVRVIPGLVWAAIGALAALALALALFSAVQSRRAARLARERRALLDDLDVLQDAVLPAVPAAVGALQVSVAHRAAAGPAAGGDFHDVVALPSGRVALVVGDIAGHGRDAVGKAALVRFTLRAHLEGGADAREALEIAAASLDGHFDDDFATVVVAVHDPRAGTLTYATAAHAAPIILGPGAHEPLLTSVTTPLGAGGRPARRQTIVPFGRDAVACLLTDGAFEARVGEELVGRDQLAAWLEELGPDASAEGLVRLITSRAAVTDDLAVCVARGRAGADSGAWRVEELHLTGGDAARGEADRFLAACGIGTLRREETLSDLALALAGGQTVIRVRIEDGEPTSIVTAFGPHPAGIAA
jgi:Stage II sporulation protein E (SpoIIE)